MKTSHFFIRVQVVFTAVALASGFAHGASKHYSITDLGTLPGVITSGSPIALVSPEAINNSGQISGYALSSNLYYRAFLYENGVMRDLGVGTNFSAGSVNETGLIIGQFTTAWDSVTVGRDHAFIYSNGVITDLSLLFGRYVSPGPLNNAGDFVGTAAADDTTTILPFVRTNGVFQLLDSTNWQFSSINDSGQIFGTVNTWDTNGVLTSRPAFFANGTATILGLPKHSTSAIGTFVNNNGTAIGYTSPCCEDSEAFVYRRGKFLRVKPLPGDKVSQLGRINNADVAVGSSLIPDGRSRAIRWRKGKTENLNRFLPGNSGWELISAHAINDQGQIVGIGLYQGEYRGFLLEP